ncbi:hypothetical protein [Jiangella sp. DSM 45060]|uniref:hypothetical protein n=1 Tax=Jiangella sp. DSM 45060 TaxID=1798224 RepID=UPI00087A4E8F|nr:hypothetical protein [Jiangella sp. DSM 45060]SDT37471.1 hypothetical protein SAMN04515669_3772 [Jiangella sp. DSM 45060]
MQNVPTRAPGVTTWSWFVDDSTGHMTVHAEPGTMPIIRVHLKNDGQEQVFDFAMTVADAFRAAEQITDMARAGRRAEWTPDVIQYVNDTYFHGWYDDDVVQELDKLADYLDAPTLLQPDGTLTPVADAVLKARWSR